jgi:hypothetical protein
MVDSIESDEAISLKIIVSVAEDAADSKKGIFIIPVSLTPI